MVAQVCSPILVDSAKVKVHRLNISATSSGRINTHPPVHKKMVDWSMLIAWKIFWSKTVGHPWSVLCDSCEVYCRILSPNARLRQRFVSVPVPRWICHIICLYVFGAFMLFFMCVLGTGSGILPVLLQITCWEMERLSSVLIFSAFYIVILQFRFKYHL